MNHVRTEIRRGQRPPSWTRRLTVVGVILVVLTVGSFVAKYHHSVWHQLSISVVRQNDAYDELFFLKSRALPSRLPAGSASEFSFEIERVGIPTMVHYAAELKDAQNTTTLSIRSVLIQSNAPYVVTEHFQVPVPGPFEIEIVVPSQRLTINFHGEAL